MLLKPSVSQWPTPELLIMLLGEDGEKKLEKRMKDALRMVSQAVGLAGLEVSLCSTGYKNAELPGQKLKMQLYRDTSLHLKQFIRAPGM